LEKSRISFSPRLTAFRLNWRSYRAMPRLLAGLGSWVASIASESGWFMTCPSLDTCPVALEHGLGDLDELGGASDVAELLELSVRRVRLNPDVPKLPLPGRAVGVGEVDDRPADLVCDRAVSDDPRLSAPKAAALAEA